MRHGASVLFLTVLALLAISLSMRTAAASDLPSFVSARIKMVEDHEGGVPLAYGSWEILSSGSEGSQADVHCWLIWRNDRRIYLELEGVLKAEDLSTVTANFNLADGAIRFTLGERSAFKGDGKHMHDLLVVWLSGMGNVGLTTSSPQFSGYFFKY